MLFILFIYLFFNMNFIEHNTKSQNKTKRYNKAYNRESLNNPVQLILTRI